ncbi:hypothetical protein [Cyclobacterium amurskyense]|jgi:hypothetical protein|uniref:Uncharacterized protein n=1 Tax=Cyclobacterium amurskyense TaxID=320787 RepID=A0A0H4PDI6_9BACT|nr:hypothetical protein [Cyclobacterium amurskyense]AKP50893.1 hypothetical protein CA2015_1454 [Cyclobacterium amurskyense]|tara:strand:+ start:466 stop:858 length:393 start_codon:yes stop_codon:yes gene_type:complete
MEGTGYTVVVSIMISLAAAYFIIEILLMLNNVDNDTSNILLLEWSKGKSFFIPFALGAIAGHLFLGTTNDAFKMSNGMFPVLIIFGLTLIMVLIGFKVPFKKTKAFLTSILIAGVLFGHFFWSMNYIVRP